MFGNVRKTRKPPSIPKRMSLTEFINKHREPRCHALIVSTTVFFFVCLKVARPDAANAFIGRVLVMGGPMRYPTVCLPPGCRQLLIPLIVSRKMESLQQKEKEEEDAEEAF